ncbi:hypothetical protein [Clostridium sp. 001]|uniref:5' nucleotidase, NT5C type n=1 Tax=Clostridium sp. 001 TaxID=1970093 RepID=UPI001C2C51AC|nr:hypothetical protein [Clostridium sp. 001]QXE18941.1 hypothetical protein B5S50_08905 [Clostridium sp. 001]
MKNMNICIDIDGTITDPYYWIESANKYFNKNITADEVTQYELHKIIGITRDEYTDFYNKIKFELHSEETIRKDAVEVIQKLAELNNIYFVTAREKCLEIVTHKYLNKYEIPYDGVYVLGSAHKVGTAKNLNCDIFIEDSYENAIELSKSNFKVLLVDTNYNRLPLNQNITRVLNWNEIYNTIEKMLLQEKAM